jgi:hypothetical protein
MIDQASQRSVVAESRVIRFLLIDASYRRCDARDQYYSHGFCLNLLETEGGGGLNRSLVLERFRLVSL